MTDALSFFGACLLGYCMLVGAWIVLRWGMTGVLFLWRKRSQIDTAVRQDVELVLSDPVEK